MPEIPIPAEGRYVLLTFMVTNEGEKGHPMDHVLTRVDLAADGTPQQASIDVVTDRIRREVQRKAQLRPDADTDHCGLCGDRLYSPAETETHNRIYHNVGPIGTVWAEAEPETRQALP